MSITKNIFVGIFAKLIIIAVLFVNNLLILKILGPKLQGAYFLLIITNGFLLNFLNFGINISNTTFLAKDKFLFGKANSNAVILALVSGFISLSLYFLLYKFLYATVFRDIDSQCMFIAVCLLPFSMYEILWTSMMTGLDKIILLNKLQIIKNVAYFLMNIIVLITLNCGFYGAFYSWVCITVFFVLIEIYISNRMEKLKINFYPKVFKKMFFFGLKNYWGNVATIIWKRSDIYLINLFNGITAVGYYSLAVTLRDAVWQLIEPVSNAIFAKVAKFNKEESINLTLKIVRHIALNSLLISMAFIVLGYLYIKFLLGSAYTISIIPLIILLIGSPAISISIVLSVYLIGQLNKPGLVSIFAWVNTTINLALCLFLIPKYNILGAAVSSTVMCIIGVSITLAAFRKSSGCKIKDVVLIRAEDFICYFDIFKKIKSRIGLN